MSAFNVLKTELNVLNESNELYELNVVTCPNYLPVCHGGTVGVLHYLNFVKCIMLTTLSLREGSMMDYKNSEMARILHRPIRALTFPETSTMGIFFALAVPLEPPRNSVSLSYFFEATYNLPVNSTSFVSSYDQKKRKKRRGIDRTTIYQTVENKFERSGSPGRKCLLRSICETSELPLQHNGVLGDIIRVIFTPSTSRDEDLSPDIIDAERFGRRDNCSKYHSDCPVGLFDLIGILV